MMPIEYARLLAVTGALLAPGRTLAMAPGDPSIAKFGILYTTFHCRASSSLTYDPPEPDNPGVPAHLYDISRALQGLEPWGPMPWFHWWSRPDLGYYCLADRPDVLREHAVKLAAAGIDYIVVDASNHAFVGGTSTIEMTDPVDLLMSVWSDPALHAPKVVFLAHFAGVDATTGVPAANSMPAYFLQKMRAYPELQLMYDGKPLMLVVPGGDAAINAKVAAFASTNGVTVKKMSALLQSDPTLAFQSCYLSNGDSWSYMQMCDDGFKRAGGGIPCNQQVTTDAQGNVEQISVSAAVPDYYMSATDMSIVVPKLHGATFLRQLETVYLHPDAPIVLINSWNEWISQRRCVGDWVTRNGVRDFSQCVGGLERLPNGNYVFTDEYDDEYSRDLEPGGSLSAYYYYLMKTAISYVRLGRNPVDLIGALPYDHVIRGYLDGVFRNADGSYYLAGWACATNTRDPINVRIVFRWPDGSVTSSTVTADADNEDAVSAACQSSGTKHRFSMALTTSDQIDVGGLPIEAYGVDPSGVGDVPLKGSASFVAPALQFTPDNRLPRLFSLGPIFLRAP